MQPNLRRPAELLYFRHVEKLLRRAVRARRIKLDLALETDDLCDLGSEVGDGDVLPGPDIEKAQIGIMLHQENAGIAEIIGAEKLPSRLSGAPHRHRRRVRQFPFVKPAEQR